MVFIALLTLTIVLAVPGMAYAWGPATHLELGNAILNNTGLLSAPARALIEAFPFDFLYGNISADIVVGKNLCEELKHCHNWKIGFKLKNKTESDSQKAFALGYLSHLAADTIAHNHFIPEMMIRSFSARTLRHIYWELRFDAMADKKVWLLPKKMIKRIHTDNDRLLDSIFEGTPLSFRTNKTIFSSLMNLNKFEHWHRMLTHLSRSSRWTLEEDVKRRYFIASLDAITDLLVNSQKASCLKKDPTGKHNLNAALLMRKKLVVIKKKVKDWESALDNAVMLVKL